MKSTCRDQNLWCSPAWPGSVQGPWPHHTLVKCAWECPFLAHVNFQRGWISCLREPGLKPFSLSCLPGECFTIQMDLTCQRGQERVGLQNTFFLRTLILLSINWTNDMKCKKKWILFEKVLLGSLHIIASIFWTREVIIKRRVACV